MSTELFLLTVLPISIDPAEARHVSLHIAPRLTPDGGSGKLEDFPLFSDWGARLSGAAITLRNGAGQAIAATPVIDDFEPDLWTQVFPGDTPVAGFKADTFAGRQWRTFSAAAVHDTTLATHLVAMLASPDVPPPPSRSPTATTIRRLVARLSPPGTARMAYDERVMTRALDEIVRQGASGTRTGIYENAGDPVLAAVAQIHQARRYYERPEAAQAYVENPTPAPRKPIPITVPDFHERVAWLADQPKLQRKLGLVIDLKVTDLAALAAAGELMADVVPEGTAGIARPLRTSVVVSGTKLLPKPRTGEWKDGFLRLGNPDLYRVLLLDADGSALKLDRFLWSLPRMFQVEGNGDPITAAPPALRVGGLTAVRKGNLAGIRDQLDTQQATLAKINAGTPVVLGAEDVIRGMRVDVWDDTAKNWFSLHQRILSVDVDGVGPVIERVPDEGYIQGSNVTETASVAGGPLHVHDALFGWSGWSLSAPRPGPRVSPYTDKTEDPQADPGTVTPIHSTSEVAPGTLPRLRFGRSYAFRVRSVDIAGNSPPVGGAPQRRTRGGGPAAPPAPQPVAPYLPIAPDAMPVLSALRQEAVMLPRTNIADSISAAAQALGEHPITGIADIDHHVRSRLSPILQARAPLKRSEMLSSLFKNVLDDEIRMEPQSPISVLRPEGQAPPAAPPAVADDTISPLVPYLRFEPILPPVVVPRRRMSQGESVLHLVIRSGVTHNGDGSVTIEPPDAYAARMVAEHGDLSLAYEATSERHLAPPKGSLDLAELHGRLDDAIGATDAAKRRRGLALALRDDGTLLDTEVVDVDDPATRHPQPNVELTKSSDGAGGKPDSVPLPNRGDPIPSGYYVIHDTDQLTLPYLPDPMAHGACLVFSDAGRDRPIPAPFSVESLKVEYGGEWPALQPLRLVLKSGEMLNGSVDGSVLNIALPPGDTLRFRLSSSLRLEELDLLGLWRMLPQTIRDNPLAYGPAAEGYLWAFTPAENIALIHAVPKPLEAPRPTVLNPLRIPGDTAVTLLGALDCHGPSTERIDAVATWEEVTDDLSRPEVLREEQQAMAFTVQVNPPDDLIVFTRPELPFPQLEDAKIPLHHVKHNLPDTRHRMITYRFRGTTRFREYFPPSLMSNEEERSVLGPARVVSVPSSARPAAPLVHSIVPLFRWEEGTEPEQPFAVRRTRRPGVRIYLERPWFSSGDGELLGVLVGGTDPGTPELSHISHWGSDPIWLQKGPAQRRLYLELQNFAGMSGFDDTPDAARPVRASAILPLVDLPTRPSVQVLGYKPEYSPERRMWFVDVAFDPGSAFWPFVRLVVARYQPNSLPGLHLSRTVLCDFAQLAPERVATLSRPDEKNVRIVVSGPVGIRSAPPGMAGLTADAIANPAAVRANRRLIARLEKRDETIVSDLGWKPQGATELFPAGGNATRGEFGWFGMLALPEPIPPTRPGQAEGWRVTVEEWEAVEADPQPVTAQALTQEWRLIYADHLPV